MAIIRFDFDSKHDGFHHVYHGTEPKAWPEGAYCPLGSYNSPEERAERGSTFILWEEYVGQCLYDWESNGRDDSDFYMMVWDFELKRPKPICFASTRGWSYPSYGSKPDATDYVLDLWKEWKAEQIMLDNRANRILKAKALRTEHTIHMKLVGRHGIKLATLRKWQRTENKERFARAYALLQSTKLRNEFRKKLQAQLIAWLKEREHKYNSPFSFKQWNYV